VLNGGMTSNDWIEVGFFLILHISYIAHVGIELISAVIPVCCGLPLAIEIFSPVIDLMVQKEAV
jgi:hypothetical protein